MKKKIVPIIIAFVFLMCNTVFATDSMFSDVAFNCSDDGILTISGKVASGEDRLVYLDVTDRNNKSIHTEVISAEENGMFIFVINTGDWDNEEYLFYFCDEEANRYEVSKSKPFDNSGNTVRYVLLNREIWFENEYSMETAKNVIKIEFENAELMQGVVDESLYNIEGVPGGIAVTAEVEDNTLSLKFFGESNEAVAEVKELTVTLKPGIVITSGGESLEIAGITMIPSELSKTVRYVSGNMSFSMKNSTQAADNTDFTVTLLRDVKVRGKLEKGVHFEYNDENIEGLKIDAYASNSDNCIKFELSGTAKNKITEDLYVEDFVIKNVVVEGATDDSLPEKIKVIAKKGTQNTGSSSGGSSSGGSFSGGSGTTVGGGFSVSGGAGNTVQNIITTDPGSIEATVPDRKVNFSDMTNHWAKNEVKILAGKGIVNGVGNNMFAPDRSVTRAEFLKMIVLGFGFGASGTANCFEDVKTGDWFYSYVLAGLKNGIISEDVNFRPDDTITRQEMAKMATEATLKNVSAPEILISTKTYADSANISDWAIEYIEKGTTLGLFKGDEQQRFLPNSNTTRAAAAVVVYRALSYNGM